jgi:hypothetical protein
VQAVGEEGKEDVRLDPLVLLVEDGTHAQVALQIFEGFLDLREGDVVLPERGGIALGEIAAQKVAPFAPIHLAQARAVEADAEGDRLGCARFGRRFGQGDFHGAPAEAGGGFGGAEFHRQVFVSKLLGLQGLQPRAELF